MTLARAPHALLVLAAASATLMGWAADARAQGSAPAPCSGMIFTDPEGDEDAGPDAVGILSPLGQPSPLNRQGQDPYLDITGAFFNHADAGGKKVLTANIKLKDLVPTVPAESYDGTVQYIADFDPIGAVDWVRAVYDGSAWAFDYGLLESEDQPATPTETTGRVFTGPGGVVQIDFPAVPEITGGAVVEGIQAISGMWASSVDGNTSLWFYSDIAPTEDSGTYTVTDCPAGSTPPPPPTTTPTNPGPSPSAPPPASSNPPAAQQPGPTHVNYTRLPFTTPKALGSARKAAKKRTLVVKGRASATITGLVVQLRKGRKVVGTAKAATFSGSRTLKLKLKSRKLKKGAYKLVASGTVNGKALAYSRKVTLKK
jgi:hypothetical protein